MPLIDELLAPIPGENPSGEDLSLLPEFLELDSMIKGREETQFSSAVRPDWKLVHQRCLELFKIGKHLQVATVFCVASLETGGLAAAATALEVLAALLPRYWDSIQPRLDPADKLDPLERMNILSALTSPIGTFGDSFRFVERLRETPLAASPVLGRLSLADFQRSTSPAAGSSAPLEPAQIDAAFRDTPPEQLAATREAIVAAAAAVRTINEFLGDVPGAGKAPSFAPLLQQFAELGKCLVPYLVTASPVGDPAGEAPAPAAPLSGVIANRNDVVMALDRVCAYYAQHEPSSPVPLLVKRARRLVTADFLGIMADLAPDAVSQVRSATGANDPAA